MSELKIIAGPCLAESWEIVDCAAAELKRISDKLGLEIIFKASYRKANRTSGDSFEGAGDEIALNWIADAGKKYGMKTLTDIHTAPEAAMAAKYVDIIQIPAFLARQTDLLVAAAKTGKTVNIKKGQFMAPEDMEKAAKKITSQGNANVWLTERGTFFGYHDLVVDFRSMIAMQSYGFPVIYDATHSVQRPSVGEQSGGSPQFIEKLAKAAVAIGADGIFFETHPDPRNAMSDSATQLPLAKAEEFLISLLKVKSSV